MKKYILFALSGLFLHSCIDTEVLPYDITISDDMWKTKAQVTQMVKGAYGQMCAEDVVTKFIVWGGFRSDDIVPLANDNALNNGNDTYRYLTEMYSGIMDEYNTFADWSPMYTVINRCNLVLGNAPAVMSIDPAYTESTYSTDKSQMLALRALVYFYLVRTFRDVPYITEAYTLSTQDTDVPLSAPGVVLDNCIADLQEAAATPLSARSNDVSVINKDGIYSILADIYLWRASMTHNADDYQKCIDYCDLVIESKRALAASDQTGSIPSGSEYPLIKGGSAYQTIFVDGNSLESIFELQMDGSGYYNPALCRFYYNYSLKSGNEYAYLQAPVMFNESGETKDATSTAVFNSNVVDYRQYTSVYEFEFGDASYIAKMILTGVEGPESFFKRSNRSDFANLRQNWILYRLTDVMLMKAEALVALAEADGDSRLTEAFSLVKAVNDRSLKDATSSVLTESTAKAEMEYMVLAERQRELCFEGKRWFDLMRYNYRHTETGAADIYKLMTETGGCAISNDMLNLMTRMYTTGAASIKAKYSSYGEFRLYYPVYNNELKLNYGLVQNPAYNN